MGNKLGWLARFALALVAIVVVAGCGGGGKSGAVGPNVPVFLTDAPGTDFDQVWVRVYQVDAKGPGGTTTVFLSTEGEVVDVASLNDGSNRFAYLGSGPLPTSTTSIVVTLDRNVSLMPTGADTANQAQFESGFSAQNGRTVVEVPYSGSGGSSLVIDFDLPNWQVNGSLVTPVIGIGPTTLINSADRHHERPFFGTVRRLTGTPPDQTFELVSVDARHVTVVTDAETVIFGPDGAMADLADGQRVAVMGRFDTNVGALRARAIQILGPNDHGQAVIGVAFDPNPTSGTFLLEVKEAVGFIPNHRIITVSTPEGTVFLSPSGEPTTKERFYAALADGRNKVVARGQYDPASNLFTARVVKLHHDHDTRVEVSAAGEILEIDPAHTRFLIALREWHGFEAQPGDRVKVVTGDETLFFAPDGTPIRASAFYNRAGPGTHVAVQGLYTDGAIRAKQVKVLRWSEGDTPDEASGIVHEVHPDRSAFSIALRHWSGFEPPSLLLTIVVTNSTLIVDGEGHEFTAEQFFHEIGPGGAVSAFGQFEVDHLTARKIVVHRWNGHVRFAGVALEWSLELSTVIVGVGDGPGSTNLFDRVKVGADASTHFFAHDGSEITKEQFFAELSVGTRLAVEGVFDGTVVHAGAMKLL